MPITDTVRGILMAASEHPCRMIMFPDRLPVAAQRAVAQSLHKAGLLKEVAAEDGLPGWRATDAGVAAVGCTDTRNAEHKPQRPATSEEGEVQPSTSETRQLPRGSLREIGQALLLAWDADPAQDRHGLAAAVEVLRGKLTSKLRTSSPRQPRSGTKRVIVVALLRRHEGATVAQVVEATGWTRHTVHGFFAGLKKAGTNVEVLERVRQVGAGQGVKRSYTVYRVAA